MLDFSKIDDPVKFIEGLSPKELAEFDRLMAGIKWDWEWWARPNQLPPPGNWMTWLVLAGRGFGKTRTGAEWVRDNVTSKRAGRIALIAETQKDLEEVMVFGDSGIMSVFPPDQKPKVTKKPIKIEFHTGAVASGYNATEPDQLRGPQFDLAWGDEMCFVAGTQVETEFGPRSIENIAPGDLVWTRCGLKPVVKAWMSSPNSELWRLETTSGRELVGTANHPVFTEKNGFLPLSSLVNGVMLRSWPANAQYGAERLGIFTEITSVTDAASYCTARNIRMSSARLRRKLISTTSMAISSITSFPILGPLLGQSISWLSRAAVLLSGILRLGVRTQARMCGAHENPIASYVTSVGLRSNRSGCGLSSVRLNAGRRISEIAIPAIDNDSVNRVTKLGRSAAVYNIEVEGSPEYFAGGLLVHNCKWRYARETWDQLQFGLRLGAHPRQIITTTPRPIPILKEILVAPTTVVTRGVTTDNGANLAASFIKAITDKYAGTRLGRQELSAEILDDVPDALWTRTALDRDRRKPDQIPQLKRIVVAIDPAAKKNDMPDDGAATGIIVAGVGEDNRGYVLDDATCRESPNGWARMAVACFDRYSGDCIVGEINNGGDMVASTVRAVRSTVPFKEVHASKGKWTRAEPIAALYEQGRISHVGTFASLEDEMVNFGPNGMVGDASPDRVDALVWALTELFPVMTKKVAPRKPMPRTPIIGSDNRNGHDWMAS